MSAATPLTTTEDTPVYFWYFEDAATDKDKPGYSLGLRSLHPITDGVELVVNAEDGRTRVDPANYSTANGKYRAVVKLFLLFEKQVKEGVTPDQASWAIATGWLVSGDVVVTAGHCAYDYSHSLGRLIKVKAYVGYGSSTAAFRYGTAVATTGGWINTDGGLEPRDIAFIKLNTKFDDSEVKRFYSLAQTPMSQKGAYLGVVGYPSDLADERGESGGGMYEMFNRVDYDLEGSPTHMLRYQIDTFGGNSGSPVFSSPDATEVIGVHVLGGMPFNSASVIDGPYGNRCHAYCIVTASLTDEKHNPDGSTQPDDSRKWLWMCTTTTTELGIDPVQAGLADTIAQAQTVDAEIPATILDDNQPLSFGPDAGPQIAILASAAIFAAGRLAADSKPGGSNTVSIADTHPYDGVLGRAILAESALQHFFTMTSNEQATYSTTIGPLVAALKPFVLTTSPKILKGTLEPSIRLLLSNMSVKLDTKNKREPRTNSAEMDTGFGRKLTDQESVFLQGLMGAAGSDSNNEAVESFFSTLTTIGDVIGSALVKAGPIITDVARIGLPLLLEAAAETSVVPAPSALDALAHRAILAEACLQALIGMDDGPKKTRIYPKIINNLKVLGPKLVRATPFLVKHIAPVVAGILHEVNEGKNK